MGKIDDRKCLTIIVEVVVIYLVTFALGAMALMPALTAATDMSTNSVTVISSLAVDAVLIVVFLLLFKDLDPFGGKPGISVRHETPFIVAGLVSFLLLGILTGTILAGLMPENYSEYSSAFGLGTGNMGIIETLWLVVAAPVAEEIMCRGVVFKAVRSGHGFWLAAIISSLLWAVIHMDLIQGISTFILGLLLALLMEKFGSLWVCIGAHMLNNVIAILPSDVFTLPNELKYRVIMAVAVTVVVLALTRALAVHKTDVPDADTGISII